MTQGIARPLTGQLVTYRQQALAAPTMLDEGLLAPSHMAGVVAQHGFQGRDRLFPPHHTLWTFVLQVLSPDGSCREALSRVRPWQIAKGQAPGSPNCRRLCLLLSQSTPFMRRFKAKFLSRQAYWNAGGMGGPPGTRK